MTRRELSPEEAAVILNGATEAPFSGKYLHNKKKGVYQCRQCGSALFLWSYKFDSGCGWPSFDEAITGAVTERLDADGRRIEIVCSHCDGHLGHVFQGEGFTEKNMRYCVNSLSLDFEEEKKIVSKDRAVFASGCFWGTQYHFSKLPGVLETRTGYAGGNIKCPSYEQVCKGDTGHVESVEVVFDSDVISYEELLKLYFETHNFSQSDGQGPDRGSQYLSRIFYLDQAQKEAADNLINQLKSMGHHVETRLLPFKEFWKAEEKHQNYYEKTGGAPYCHIYQKIFPDN